MAMKNKKQKGFTMVELLVVVTIIAVLTAVGAVSYGSTAKKSRDAKRTSDIEAIRTALELYRSDEGEYPVLTVNASTCITSSSIASATETYLEKVPTDPINTTRSTVLYCYKYSGNATSYTLTIYLEGENGAAEVYNNP